MDKRRFLLITSLVLFVLFSYAQTIPVIELRINNTISTKDDYVSSDYVPCNIRLINGESFSTDIPVVLRNISYATGGQVLFSATGGTSAGESTLNIVAARDNSFRTFYIKGSPGFASHRDKDAIIEITDNREAHNAIVLGRKSFMVVPSSPITASLPQIELQINSVSTLDDYVTWSPTPCRIRLINHNNFSAPVNVTLRNMTGVTGRVNFANSTLAYNTTASATSLNLSLPNTGTWVDFFIAGSYGNPSLRDKDAIIEVVKQGSQTEIVQDTVSSGGGGYDSTVVTRDTLISLRDTLITSTAERTELVTDSITKIFIKGTVVRVRDTVITETRTIIHQGQGGGPVITQTPVTVNDSTVLLRESLMVRVRKNANNISVEERQRFLNALTTLNNTFNLYQIFDAAHGEAANPEAHSGPGFLAWHRAFTLTFERQLQTIDPSVTIPYWRFDLAAPNVLSMDFMGARPTASGDAFADFNPSDPLIAWNITGGPGIRRTTAYANNAAPPSVKSNWYNEAATLALGTNYTMFRRMEDDPHGYAHIYTGSRSGDWLMGVGSSVRDPLFFLLHSNVDRIWARWQWINNRFDAQNTATFSPQGSYPNSGTIHIGHYLNDTLWPWNGVTGNYTGSGTVYTYDRPTTAPGGPLPDALSITSPVNIPRPLNMIDYRNNRLINTTNSGMGYCYDDVPFN